MALLEADVALPVVKTFIASVKERALGSAVQQSLTPGQVFIKILHEELVAAMGEPGAGLNLRAQPPVVVLLAGLQGAGKTTTAAKLAKLLMELRKSASCSFPATCIARPRLPSLACSRHRSAPASSNPP